MAASLVSSTIAPCAPPRAERERAGAARSRRAAPARAATAARWTTEPSEVRKIAGVGPEPRRDVAAEVELRGAGRLQRARAGAGRGRPGGSARARRRARSPLGAGRGARSRRRTAAPRPGRRRRGRRRCRSLLTSRSPQHRAEHGASSGAAGERGVGRTRGAARRCGGSAALGNGRSFRGRRRREAIVQPRAGGRRRSARPVRLQVRSQSALLHAALQPAAPAAARARPRSRRQQAILPVWETWDGKWEKMCKQGCIVGGSGVCSRAASRGGGAPPTPPPRLGNQALELTSGPLSRHLRPYARREEPPHGARPATARRWPRASCWRCPST